MQAALGFAESQTSHVEQEVNATVYPEIQYPALIPVDTSAHPFAKTVTYYSSDKFGQANWVNGNAGDIPMAGTELAQHETSVHMAGIGYGWGYEEINQAQMLNRNLQADDAIAARQAYEEMVDRVALKGDTGKGFKGLINHNEVTAASATTGNWDDATEDEILNDINSLILGVSTDTNHTAMADTLLLPYAKLNKLATSRLGDNKVTILSFLKENNTYTAMTGQPLMIRAIRGLETAGAGSTQRMIAYHRNPRVLKLHIPMPHRFLPIYQDSPLHFQVPGVFRLGGLDVRRPKEIRYGDGI